VRELELAGHVRYILMSADEDDVGQGVGYDSVGGGEGAWLETFRQDDALTVFAGFRGEFFKKIHDSSVLKDLWCKVSYFSADCLLCASYFFITSGQTNGGAGALNSRRLFNNAC